MEWMEWVEYLISRSSDQLITRTLKDMVSDQMIKRSEGCAMEAGRGAALGVTLGQVRAAAVQKGGAHSVATPHHHHTAISRPLYRLPLPHSATFCF